MSTEDTLTEVLHERADATSYDATPLAAVVDRARGIRRRRRLGVTGAVAAIAAAAVPLALLVPGDSPDRAVSPAEGPDAPPRIGYAADGVYHRPDGTTIDLPDGEVTTVTEHEGGLIVSDDPGPDGPLHLTAVDGSGGVEDTWCATSVPVTDGTSVAWTEVSCDGGPATIVVDRPDEERQTWTVPGEPVLVGIRPVGGVVYVDATDDGAPYLSDREGFRVRVPGLTTAVGYAPATDLISGVGAGEGVVVTSTGEEVLRLGARRRPGAFSPDGARLLVQQGLRLIVVDARSGQVLTRVRGSSPDAEPLLNGGAWEDPAHLVMAALDGVRTSLVRIGPDGVSVPLPDPPESPTGIVLQTVS